VATVYPVCYCRTMLRSVILAAPEPLLQLLSDGELSLADWYGDPLIAAVAGHWAKRLQALPQRNHARAPRRFRDQLAELVARYWSGRDAEMSYRGLAAVAANNFERALLELCYGQLLLARKLTPARDHLERGFALAVHLLSPEDYFRVMKRHQRLTVLPLSWQGAEPSGLDALLKEAGVIERLVGPGKRCKPPSPDGRQRDTLG